MNFQKRWYIARGVTREVIISPNYAFKIPSFRSFRLFLHGLLANMQEVFWWQSTKDDRLCPVSFYIPFGILVVMPRVYICSNMKHVELQNFEGLPTESKPSNFGWRGGKIVIVDYGS